MRIEHKALAVRPRRSDRDACVASRVDDRQRRQAATAGGPDSGPVAPPRDLPRTTARSSAMSVKSGTRLVEDFVVRPRRARPASRLNGAHEQPLSACGATTTAARSRSFRRAGLRRLPRGSSTSGRLGADCTKCHQERTWRTCREHDRRCTTGPALPARGSAPRRCRATRCHPGAFDRATSRRLRIRTVSTCHYRRSRPGGEPTNPPHIGAGLGRLAATRCHQRHAMEPRRDRSGDSDPAQTRVRDPQRTLDQVPAVGGRTAPTEFDPGDVESRKRGAVMLRHRGAGRASAILGNGTDRPGRATPIARGGRHGHESTSPAITSCMLCHNGAKLRFNYAGPGLENPHPFPGADDT